MEMVMVDAHVHIYDSFKLVTCLDAAYRNAARQAQRLGGKAFSVVLSLTESAGNDYYSLIKQQIESSPGGQVVGDWYLQVTADPLVLVASRGNQNLYIIRGYQMATREKLEVLALGCGERFDDGEPAVETVKKVAAAGGLPVLPWAVGKWLGARGKLIANILDQETTCQLGDNGGRPVFWPAPSQFRQGRQRQRKILRGSDPLPIIGEDATVGRFGFYCYLDKFQQEPRASLYDFLLDSGTTVHHYGTLESPWRFVRNQWRLRNSTGQS